MPSTNTTTEVFFTPKEIEFLSYLCKDMTTEEIAKEMFKSPRTIETLRSDIKKKIGVKSTGALAYYAVKNKLIPLF